MYNILFVDDDVLITQSISGLLDWDKMELNPPFLANNFEQAAEIIQTENINIVISDIEMIGQDGFSLIDWVSQNYPDIICCFLTCHARFDFAQKAIRLGVKDYLLKPVIKEELESMLKSHIDIISDRPQEDKKAPLSKLTQAAIDYIHANLANVISRESICHELFVSERHLSRLFNQETGLSLSDYIAQCRIERSKELLLNTNMSITEICIATGFNYPAYYTKVFKKQENMTPLEYRKNMRNAGSN